MQRLNLIILVIVLALFWRIPRWAKLSVSILVQQTLVLQF